MTKLLEVQKASYMGAHAILDLWVEDSDVLFLKDIKIMEVILKTSIKKTGATILSSVFHSFGEDCGLTGLLLLSESHASCHTFPEKNYVAFDFFTCGKCDPSIAIEHIIECFKFTRKSTNFLLRGIDSPNLNFGVT